MKKNFSFIIFLTLFNLLFNKQNYAYEGQNNLLLSGDEKLLTVSGFIDLQYVHWNYNSKDSVISSRGYKEKSNFSQNFLNIYFTFNPIKDWLAFSEIRYTYAPTGKMETTTYDIDNDGVIDAGRLYSFPYDNTSMDSQLNQFMYGSIYIERAYIEWNKLSYAVFRFGRYFTPFGIWSQDHGAHVLTSIRAPFLVNSPLLSSGMPQTQTGIELLGRINLGVKAVMDYAAYIGNGISNSDAIDDSDDKNKAFGGFLNFTILSIVKIINLEFGFSGYRGERSLLLYKYATLTQIQSSDSSLQPATILDYDSSMEGYSTKQMDTSILCHLRISIDSLPFRGTLTLQAEGMRQWIDEYDDDRIVESIDLDSTRENEDYKYDDYYLQAEYQFYGKVTPYFRYEYTRTGTTNPQIIILFDKANIYVAGVNVKPASKVIIKCEWVRYDLSTPYIINNNMDTYQASITLAF